MLIPERFLVLFWLAKQAISKSELRLNLGKNNLTTYGSVYSDAHNFSFSGKNIVKIRSESQKWKRMRFGLKAGQTLNFFLCKKNKLLNVFYSADFFFVLLHTVFFHIMNGIKVTLLCLKCPLPDTSCCIQTQRHHHKTVFTCIQRTYTPT